MLHFLSYFIAGAIDRPKFEFEGRTYNLVHETYLEGLFPSDIKRSDGEIDVPSDIKRSDGEIDPKELYGYFLQIYEQDKLPVDSIYSLIN